MKMRPLALGACAVTGLVVGSMVATRTPVAAQSCTAGAATSVTGLAIGGNWSEVEGDWAGNWHAYPFATTHGAADHKADFVKGNEHASAFTRVSGSGSSLHVERWDDNGTCTYDGQLASGVMFVSGTYHCSGNPARVLPFSAVIGNGLIPRTMCSGTPDPRLTATWHLTEGDWSGQWSPINGRGSGQFRATMHKGAEAFDTGVQLSLRGNAVIGQRVHAKGVCNYSGSLATDGFHASGTVTCPWDVNLGGRLQLRPWSAVIGAGHP